MSVMPVNWVKGARKMWLLLQMMTDPAPVRPTPDEGWIAQIAKGDMDALRRLYDAVGDSVYAFAYSLLRDRQDAEDVLQDTFLRIHDHAAAYRPQGKPLAWIFTIARRLALDTLRRRHRNGLSDAVRPEPADLSQIENTEHRILLRALLEELSEEDRQILVLHTAAGMTFREIGVVLDMPLNTVLSRHHRGLKRLRTVAKEEM